jgi:hypothetical protein
MFGGEKAKQGLCEDIVNNRPLKGYSYMFEDGSKDLDLPKIHPEYGGTLTYIKDLPVGTKFWVCNGCWTGMVIDDGGIKKVHVLDTGGIFEFKDDYYAWIKIKKSFEEDDLSCAPYIPISEGEISEVLLRLWNCMDQAPLDMMVEEALTSCPIKKQKEFIERLLEADNLMDNKDEELIEKARKVVGKS